MEKPTFEEKIDVINRLLATRKKKWKLNALSYLDYDDVCQIIRIHIFNKWDQYDCNKPLEQWVNRIISNQIINLVEKNYRKQAAPCSSCSMNQGGNLCSFTSTGEQTIECPLLRKWKKTKEAGFNIKMAESLQDEGTSSHINASVRNDIDWTKSIPHFHELMKTKLSHKLYKVYEFLYIDNKSEEELAAVMNFKSSATTKANGYKQIYNFKQEIMKIARSIVGEVL